MNKYKKWINDKVIRRQVITPVGGEEYMKSFLTIIICFQIKHALLFSQNIDCISYKTNFKAYYDTDSVLYEKSWFSDGKIDSTHYFDTKGERINKINLMYKYLLKDKNFLKQVKNIQKKIKNEFSWKNVIPNDGQGTAIISFIIEPTLDITNARVIRGIHYSLNKELIRCIYTLTKNDVSFYNDRDFAILVTIPIIF